MTDGETFFSSIGEILGRRHRISGLNSKSGTFELHDADRTVRVTLELDLLAEYFNQLDEHDIPGLSHSPQDAQDRVRVKRIAMWIEEIFESDISLSLLEIRLGRSADGRICLVDRRGPARRSFPPANTNGGYWSADRPGT
ncbi:hypothetical protein [Streptomyces capitiformicae]|uniref:Uncharacterized protein n=1 Tax=Streptomyces capitiformicae TaxID=2014920 RepID=A0A918ZTY1_9ACTN|nr:hypothetical protein [Streptomyces capitiformicae]GHE69916.1 hypothetical protein GCM10017771_93760 [Streptomyces capitiformicae]